MKASLRFQHAKNDSLVTQTSESFTSLGEKKVVLQLPKLLEDTYNLSISVRDKRWKLLVPEKQSILYRAKKERVILIQTDKPVYKPGEIVKYRVFLLSR